MSVEAAISATVENQNPVSDFIGENTPTENPTPELHTVQEAPQKRGRGRPRKDGAAPKASKPQSSFIPDDASGDNPDAPPPAPEAEAVQRRNAALGATALVQTSGMLMAGEGGKMTKDEFSNVAENFDRYFAIKGISDFPPGISLGIALGGYYIRTLTAEKARPRVGLFMAWVRNKIAGLRRKPAAAPVEAA